MSEVTERMVKILMILIKAEGFVKLDSLMERISGAGKSTIRSDLEYLAEYFPIESQGGIHGGYRLADDPPVFWEQAEAIRMLREICGDIDSSLATKIEQATLALLAFRKHGEKIGL